MTRSLSKMGKYLTCCVALSGTFAVAGTHEKQSQTATVIVQAGGAGCRVDLDASTKGTTDTSGKLTLVDVDPGEATLLIELIEMLIKDWYITRESRKGMLASIKGIAAAKLVAKKGLQAPTTP